MPSPPSSTPSHRPSFFSSSSSSNAFSASQRTDLQSWMTYHHLPFSALTVSEPPPQAVASSSRDLVVVSAIVGRGMLGSMRVELVVPREEVFRVQRAQIGRERRSEGSRVVVGSWEGGAEVEEKDEVDLWLEDVFGRSPPTFSNNLEPRFPRPVRGEHQRGGGGAAATVQFDFRPTHEHQPSDFSTSPSSSSSSSTSPPPTTSLPHRDDFARDPLIFTSFAGFPPLRTPRSTTSPPSPRSKSILSIRCGHLPPSPSKRAQHPSLQPSYLYPNPDLHTTSPPSSSSPPTNCANRLVLKLPLPSTPITSANPHSPPLAQQANFAFLSLPHQHPFLSGGRLGPRLKGGRKSARGWIVDASLMEGRAGFLPSTLSLKEASVKELDAKEWERVQCGCSGGSRRVEGEQEEQRKVRTLGCLICGSPLGIYIPNPCVQHTLKRSSSPNASSSPNSASSSSAVWFIPDEFAATSTAPTGMHGGKLVGR